MTSRMTVPASEVRVGDHIYNGPGASAHPTYAWETITGIRSEDGLFILVTDSVDGLHGEFWFEADESVTVIRYPAPEPAKPAAKSGHKHGHGHSG